MKVVTLKRALSVTAILAILSIVGCAPTSIERKGPEIDLYPVTHSLSLQSDVNYLKKSKSEWAKFADQHNTVLMNQPIELHWANSTGASLMRFVKKDLLSRGANLENISQVEMPEIRSERFDFQLRVTEYKVVTPICHLVKVSDYDSTSQGCYTESARWQSMVRPETMLREQADTLPNTDTN